MADPRPPDPLEAAVEDRLAELERDLVQRRDRFADDARWLLGQVRACRAALLAIRDDGLTAFPETLARWRAVSIRQRNRADAALAGQEAPDAR